MDATIAGILALDGLTSGAIYALVALALRGLVLELWQRTRLDWGFVSDRLARIWLM